MEASNTIFGEDGLTAFLKHHTDNEDEPLNRGPAFPLVQALMRLNNRYEKPVVEVIIVSSIQPEAGVRVLNSCKHHGLEMKRASFVSGADIVPYLQANEVDLFITRSEGDAQKAMINGIAAALMYDAPAHPLIDEGDQIRIVFDGDAVIFDDASERVYKAKGLDKFLKHETKKINEPLRAGPFAALFMFIMTLQKEAPVGNKPFYVVLVTARNAMDPATRVMRTFKSWESSVDETHFLSGVKKAKIVQAARPHIFFDDQHVHVEPASKLVPSARVPCLDGKEASNEETASAEVAKAVA
jgi:5'-nucleotidase